MLFKIYILICFWWFKFPGSFFLTTVDQIWKTFATFSKIKKKKKKKKGDNRGDLGTRLRLLGYFVRTGENGGKTKRNSAQITITKTLLSGSHFTAIGHACNPYFINFTHFYLFIICCFLVVYLEYSLTPFSLLVSQSSLVPTGRRSDCGFFVLFCFFLF